MSNDERIREMVANGAIPTIERIIEQYKREEMPLYGAILEIGRVCDTYHDVLQTGNKVECAETFAPNNGIEYLDLSTRAYNSLKRNGVDTIQQLICYSHNELSNLHYMGRNTINEIVRRLSDKGYSLNEEAENE